MMKCTVYDLEVMGLNPSWVELGGCSTSAKVILEPKILKEFENDALRQLVSSYSKVK